MSSILSLFGVGDKSKNTDRQNQLSAWGDLTSLMNTEKNTGASMLTQGGEATGAAQAYNTKLLSGDRQAVESAVAPTTNAVASQAAAGKRARASSGTSRGGGTNAQDQASNDLVASATQSAINSAAPAAAGNLASIGGSTTATGAGLLGESGSSAGTLGELAGHTREFDVTNSEQLMQRSEKEINAIVQSILTHGMVNNEGQ